MKAWIQKAIPPILSLLAIVYLVDHMMGAKVSPWVAASEALAIGLLAHLFVHFITKSREPRQVDTVILNGVSEKLAQLTESITNIEEEIKSLRDRTCPNLKTDIPSNVGRPDFSDLFKSLKKGEILYVFDTLIPHFRQHTTALLDAVKRGALVRFLVLNPDSGVVAARSRRIQEPLIPFQEFRDGIIAYVNLVKSISRQCGNPDLIQLGYFAREESFPLYLVESSAGMPKRAIQGFYLNTASIVANHYLWMFNGPDCQLVRFHDYIQARWNEREVVQLQKFEESA